MKKKDYDNATKTRGWTTFSLGRYMLECVKKGQGIYLDEMTKNKGHAYILAAIIDEWMDTHSEWNYIKKTETIDGNPLEFPVYIPKPQEKPTTIYGDGHGNTHPDVTSCISSKGEK